MTKQEIKEKWEQHKKKIFIIGGVVATGVLVALLNSKSSEKDDTLNDEEQRITSCFEWKRHTADDEYYKSIGATINDEWDGAFATKETLDKFLQDQEGEYQLDLWGDGTSVVYIHGANGNPLDRKS